MSDWDPEQYRRFAAERAQPFWDLVDLVDGTGIDRMVDLGCGDGQLSMEAADRFAASVLVGIDSSPAMLGQAHAKLAPTDLADASGPRLRRDSHTPVDAESRRKRDWRFEEGDLAAWPAGAGGSGRPDRGWDLVLANASLQWVPDHEAVLRRWTGALAPGGQLAVQVPANGTHASHVVANEVGATEPFLGAMGGAVPPDPSATNVLAPEDYARILFELGYAAQDVTLRVYPHVLASSGDVVEWVRGTNLNRFFERLPAELHEPFVSAYRTALLDRIGDSSPYFYGFKRILVWARRSKTA